MSDPRARLDAALARVPYARFLGMRADWDGEALTGVLPYREMLIGNLVLPALHGGALGAFMEITALARLALDSPESPRQPLTIGVTVEYMRPGRPVDTFARADIKRLGRRIANVHVEAWQDENRTPIALLQGRFLLAAGQH